MREKVKQLYINGHTVLLDMSVFEMLKSMLKPHGHRKHELPLRITRDGYAHWVQRSNGEQHYTPLHHIVMGKPLKGLVTDHINRCKLDNRRSNLRHVTVRENGHNRKDNNEYVGVHWHKITQKWAAQIQDRGKRKHLGLFSCKREAADAYNRARRECERNNLNVGV